MLSVYYMAVSTPSKMQYNCNLKEDCTSTLKTPTQLRLTRDLLERADALIEVMAADLEVRALGMPTRTAVLRLAIARGLTDLERQYHSHTPAPASPRPSMRDSNASTRHLPENTLSHVYAGRDGVDHE